MSFLTCFWLFPQKEHLSRSPVSPTRATSDFVPLCCAPIRRHLAGPDTPDPERYPQLPGKSSAIGASGVAASQRRPSDGIMP